MKIKDKNKKWLPILTFSALILLLIVQVGYLFRAADLEHQNFNHRVSIALKEARDEITTLATRSNAINDYITGASCRKHTEADIIDEVDSIVSARLQMNNIDLEYTFEVVDTCPQRRRMPMFGACCYAQSINGGLHSAGMHLKVEFPERKEFLMHQITGAFFLSLLSIGVVAVSFFLTYRMFRREKMLHTHTIDFINNMVHEFQTPLANIRLATGLILKKQQNNDWEKIQQYSGIIVAENEKMQKHIENILDISCRTGQQNIPSPINICKILETLADEFTPRATNANGTISLILNAKNHIIHGDASQFRLIFSNLIDNALKYANQNPEIEIETHNDKNHLVIAIKDNGIGISASDKEHIFDKFFRVSTGDVHNTKGFGLGLTYVKKLTESYGGRIMVASEPGVGTTFTLIFNNYELENQDSAC